MSDDLREEMIEDELQQAESAEKTHTPCMYNPAQSCMLQTRRKSIGNLNGRWALLFKCYLLGAPIVAFIVGAILLPWGKWQTDEQYVDNGRRESIDKAMVQLDTTCKAIMEEIKDVRRVHETDMVDIRDTFQSLPPDEWRRRIELTEKQIDELRTLSTQVLVSLEQVKYKLGIAKDG